VQKGAEREFEQVEVFCRDVFTELSRPDLISEQLQFIKQFGLDQMDLTIVRKTRRAFR